MHLFVLYVTVGQHLLCLRNKNNLFQQIERIKKIYLVLGIYIYARDPKPCFKYYFIHKSFVINVLFLFFF